MAHYANSIAFVNSQINTVEYFDWAEGAMYIFDAD